MLIGVYQGTKATKFEKIGISLIITGCVFMVCDPHAERIGSEVTASVMPALIDASSAFFGALYFLMSEKNVKSFPICLLILLMNLHTFLINAVIAKLQNPAIQVFSVSAEYGCLGFLNMDQPMLVLGLYALLASFFGSAGYTMCLLFFPPVVTCNAYLLEPLLAQVLGYAVGLDELPGFFTVIGSVLAIQGIFSIDKGRRDATKEKIIHDDFKLIA